VAGQILNEGYCLKCGAKTFRLQDDQKRWQCQTCGFEFFQNPAAAVGALLVNERAELLVAKRARDPHAGSYDLPGGFADFGENADAALVRELEEELGVRFSSDQLHILGTALNSRYEFGHIAYSTIDIGYLIRVSEEIHFQANDDVASLEWHPLSGAHKLAFAFGSLRPLVQLAQAAVQKELGP
jgi:ADP-ribose pyrophosphatase YjhB (NUDIX family)